MQTLEQTHPVSPEGRPHTLYPTKRPNLGLALARGLMAALSLSLRTRHRLRRLRAVHMLGLQTILASGLLLSSCGYNKPSAKDTVPPAREATPVKVAKPDTTHTLAPLHAVGRLADKEQQRKSFKVGGYIASIAVDEGEHFQAGEVLARLETTEIDAKVAKARQAYRKAQRDFRRAQALYKDSVTTQEQYQNAQTALEMARSDLRRARYNREHAVIKAAASGVVMKKVAEAGELVQPGQPVLVTGAGGRQLVLRCGVPGRDLVGLSLGQSARLRFDALPDRTFRGKVTELPEAPAQQTGLFELELRLAQPVPSLRTGMIGRARLEREARTALLRIPNAAIIDANNGTIDCFVLDERSQTAERHQLQVRALHQDAALVDAQELPPGMRVITEGAQLLGPSRKIVLANERLQQSPQQADATPAQPTANRN